MERSTVSGNLIWDLGIRIWDVVAGSGVSDTRKGVDLQIPNPISDIPNQRGFSLLELMIAMFIMIILLSVAFPTYQRSVQHAREVVLQENLWQMRSEIDQVTAA